MSENGNAVHSFHDDYTHKRTLSGLKFKRVLMEVAEKKLIFVEAEVENSPHPAIITLDKLPFTEEAIQGIVSDTTELQGEMQNDIYGQYRLHPKPEYNAVKANIIHPATQKHIDKYTTSPSHIIIETPEMYHGITLPFLETEQFSMDWVYNFLDHKREVDRVIYENENQNTGFMMAPDFKWTGKQVEDLYCLAIVHKRGIKSIRDLRTCHLPLLHNLLKEGKQAIEDKYGLPTTKIRAYIHYQPSYYHFHVHFTNIEFSPPGVNCEKSHMLETVISNLEKNGRHYLEADLPFVVREKDKLYTKYLDAGYFRVSQELEVKEDLMSREFEEGDCTKVLQFLEMLGKSKHEPSGEFWESTYGESAWRMAVMSLCVPPTVNRKKLVELCLVSSLSSLGTSNDENTVWEPKIIEVKSILRAHLPPLVAGRIIALFTEHVDVRRGHQDGSEEHELYRNIMELEETLLRHEEAKKESSKPVTNEGIIKRMADMKFPGFTRYKHFKDKELLEKSFEFLQQISGLLKLKRTGWVNNKIGPTA